MTSSRNAKGSFLREACINIRGSGCISGKRGRLATNIPTDGQAPGRKRVGDRGLSLPWKKNKKDHEEERIGAYLSGLIRKRKGFERPEGERIVPILKRDKNCPVKKEGVNQSWRLEVACLRTGMEELGRRASTSRKNS